METSIDTQKKPYETPEIQVFELDKQPILVVDSPLGGYQREYD